jgi:hypothetical protein
MCTICRFGVGRAQLVDEVMDGLHPDYRTIEGKSNIRYIEAKPAPTPSHRVNDIKPRCGHSPKFGNANTTPRSTIAP